MLVVDTSKSLITDLHQLINNAKAAVVSSINREMTLLYWNLGKRLRKDILQTDRAAYGEQILPTVSAELVCQYGKGFGIRNLWRFMQFYNDFPDLEILLPLIEKLSWSHFVELMTIKDPLERTFYMEMCKLDNWSIRTLREKKGKMLYARTALSKQPQEVIKESLSLITTEGRITPDMVLQDPYVMDFLNLPEHYTESELETAILNEVSKFLLEMGIGFSFVSRQKRITVGGDDFFIDLVLYNRLLKRLIVIELKTTKFKPSYKGQIEFYLNWLDQNEKNEGEEKPIGIILCAAKDEAQIKVFDLKTSGIHIAEYLRVLPEKFLFEERLHKIVKDRISLSPPQTSV